MLSKLPAAQPEDQEKVGTTGDDLRDGSSPAQPHQRHGGLRTRHSGPVIGGEVISHSVALLGPEAQAGVRLSVLLHPGALQPHPPGLGLRHRDDRLNTDCQFVPTQSVAGATPR